MKSLILLCKPRQSVFDHNRRDVALDLTDLAEDRIDPGEFFEENYFTAGMRYLLREAFRRCAGKSPQGVFVLVVAFTGRESDAPLGIWGAIAGQLGKRELFEDYYSPLAAPGQKAWVNLLRGKPLLILLDELPPYFENARSKPIGNSDLAVVTTTALSTCWWRLARTSWPMSAW
jgi:predicted AAA+ superfamily ATPase